MAQRSDAHAALGRAILRARRRQRISQEELAARAGMDRTYVGGIERGEENPSLEKILLLAEALEMRASQLVLDAEQERVGDS